LRYQETHDLLDICERTDSSNASGVDGFGCPTYTVRELIATLQALPEEVMDLPVTRYCEDGIAGYQVESGYRGENWENRTFHLSLW
jgi:hypothetical protein